jgi:hypothetical protein
MQALPHIDGRADPGAVWRRAADHGRFAARLVEAAGNDKLAS